MSSRKPVYVRFAARKQQADVLKANAYGGIAFCKEEAKTFGQFTFALGKMNNGRPKIPFWWRHKFPPGCDGRVSKFPIQSLLLSMLWYFRKWCHVEVNNKPSGQHLSPDSVAPSDLGYFYSRLDGSHSRAIPSHSPVTIHTPEWRREAL